MHSTFDLSSVVPSSSRIAFSASRSSSKVTKQKLPRISHLHLPYLEQRSSISALARRRSAILAYLYVLALHLESEASHEDRHEAQLGASSDHYWGCWNAALFPRSDVRSMAQSVQLEKWAICPTSKSFYLQGVRIDGKEKVRPPRSHPTFLKRAHSTTSTPHPS